MKIFKVMVGLFIVSFLGLYFIYQNGYYEKVQENKVIMTNEMIEKFESDIQEGREVLLENYFEEEEDYSTATSKMSLKLTNKAEGIINDTIKFVFRKLGSVIE